MKKATILKISAGILCLGLAGFSAINAYADDDATTTTTESKSTESTVHPEGEEDAVNGKISEVSPDAPPILIQISPVSNQVILEAGKTKEYTMTVKNSGKSDFSYHLYTTPYSVSDENYNVDFSTETARTQVSRWIKFYQGDKLVDKPTFKIKSGETQLIKYVIQIPTDIPAGGQYATIFAETDASDDKAGASENSGIRTASRVGLIIYGRTNGETVEKAEITDFNVPGFITSGNVSATSKIKNSGNTDFEASYSITVNSILGAELYSKQSSYNILPDTERRVTLEWAETPFMGMFKVKYKITMPGDQGEREEEKLVIKYPVIMIIVTILVLTGLIIGIIMVVRKRRERKARLAV